jgi:thymidylate synthase (FAD)
MKLIKPSVEIFHQDKGLEGIYKQIEKAARVCYKSEDKITGTSAKDFVNRMIKSGHGAMLEHGTVYFKIPANIDTAGNFLDEVSIWTKCKLVKCSEGNWWAITTNFRVMVEHFASEYIEYLIEKYLCEPTEYHEKRITVKFTTSISIGREILRHRKASFANESTRYCNYSNDKFGNEITFIEPSWYKNVDSFTIEGISKVDFDIMLREAEKNYFIALNNGLKPEEARDLLPLCTKSELVMTAFESDWEHFFDLRYFGKTGRPHPDIKKLAEDLYNKFKEMRN